MAREHFPGETLGGAEPSYHRVGLGLSLQWQKASASQRSVHSVAQTKMEFASNMSKQVVLIVATLMLFALGVAQNQQAQQFVHPLTDMPGPLEDVETSFVFPDSDSSSTTNKFPLGQTVTILCHFSNNGASPVNVSAIMGSLNHVLDFRYHIQNYTYKPFGVVVKGGEEVTVSLKPEDG